VAEYPLFMVAVSFLAYLPPTVAVSTLQRRVVALESAIAGLDTALRSLQEEFHLPRLYLVEQEYMRALRQAELAWVRAVIADIRSGRLSWDLDPDWARWDGETPISSIETAPPIDGAVDEKIAAT
nr:hypothetical protein [Chloroflexota bacterium]